MTHERRAGPSPSNGGALAAVLAAAIGSFSLGLLVLANAAGWYAAPSLYGPAGGLSGRTTFALIVWLVSWAILHARWKDRAMRAGGIFGWSLVLIALSLVLTFPPVWDLF
jgi:hypothetical protein